MSGDLSFRWYCVTRSTRRSARPQLWAMSVAFDAQGDTVPRRGVTTTEVTALAGASKGSP
jgi:hypothetical protein